VSAEIIQFVPRARSDRQPDERGLFRSSERVDDLVMDHADTAPCEILPAHEPCEDDVS
jgi:hypothetical protein